MLRMMIHILKRKKMTEEEDVDSTRNIFKKRGISSHATIT